MIIEIKNIRLLMSIDYDERSVWLPKYFIVDIQPLLLFRKEHPYFFKEVSLHKLIETIMKAEEHIQDISIYCCNKLNLKEPNIDIERIDTIIEELIEKLYNHLGYILVGDDDLYQFHLWVDRTSILLIKKDEVSYDVDEDVFK